MLREQLKLHSEHKPKKTLDEIVNEVFKALKLRQDTYTRGEIVDPDFIKKLHLSLSVISAVGDGNKLTEVLKKIFDNKKIDLKKLLKII